MIIVYGLLLSLVLSLVAWDEVSAQPVATPGPIATHERAFEFYPEETGFGTYVDRTLNPGEAATVTMLVGNTGTVEQSFVVYPTNARTAEGGGFLAADVDEPTQGVTDWLDLESQEVTLEPGTGQLIEFTIRVPEGAEPGQYLTAVAAQHATDFAVEGSDAFRQIIRFAIPVFIRVPGAAETIFSIDAITASVDDAFSYVSIDIRNDGDIRVRPEGTITIRDSEGRIIATIPVAMDSVYAHDGTTLTVGAMGVLDDGEYLVAVDLIDPESQVTVQVEQVVTVQGADAGGLPGLSIEQAGLSPMPSADDVQFVAVDAVILNMVDAPILNAQLSLVAYVDGQEVERFPIVQALSLQPGETPISTRYIPANGWSSGTWTFELLIETVEQGGVAVVVARQPLDEAIVVS